MRKLLISAAISVLFTLPISLSAWAQPGHDEERGHGGGGPQHEEHGGGPRGGPAPQEHGGPPGGGHFERGGGGAQPGANQAFSRGTNGGGSAGRPAMTGNPAYSRGPAGGGLNRQEQSPNTAYSRGPAGGGLNRQEQGPNTAYSRGPAGGGFERPSQASNPAYSRGPGQGGNFRERGGPAMATRQGEFNRPSGGRHDFRGFGDFHRDFNAERHFHAGAYRRPGGWYPHHWVYGEFLPGLFWTRNYWLLDYVDFGLPPPPYGAVWVRVGDDALLIDQDTGEIITVEYGVFY